MKKIITPELKKLIESNPIALATVMPDGRPNVISIAHIRAVDTDKLLITDNYMNQTLTDIINDPHVVVIVITQNNLGAKFIGKAKYFDTGPWWDEVKSWPENQNFPVKGAVLVAVSNSIVSA
jgi:predicted pyridoxine 5'-phosphate oxidase superfamily flavin-nucleotide-binding protein